MAFNHADNATRARSAARTYFAFSAGVTLICTWALAGSVAGGRPRGRFGVSMTELWHTQIILDKPFSPIFCVYTSKADRSHEMTTGRKTNSLYQDPNGAWMVWGFRADKFKTLREAEHALINWAYQRGMPVRDGVTTAADAERYLNK
jgi:hypothetical protein